MERVHCPRHVERTPSCVIYPTFAYCYGGCGRIPLTELGRTPNAEMKPRYQENLEETRAYIASLQKKIVRGFEMPFDDRGYYLLFPGSLYYKRRNWTAEPKYKNPSGHPQPLFVARQGHSRTLFLVEGEVNALSVSHSFPDCDVMSPGSATGFTKLTGKELLTLVLPYCTLNVCVDRDAPGVKAAIHVQGFLAGKVPNLNVALMTPDANEIFCESGPKVLNETITNLLSVRGEKDQGR